MLLRFIILGCGFITLTGGACVKLPRAEQPLTSQNVTRIAQSEDGALPLVNINQATTEELEKLPGIGQALAARIVEHRRRYGPFRRVEHLLMVRGISVRRFRELRGRLTAQ